MPILKDARTVKEIKLPESGITVKVKDGLLTSDILSINEETNQIKQSMMLLSRLIIDWDADDENGTKLSITPDNITLLSIGDLKYIQDNLDTVNDFLAQAMKQDMRS